MAQLTLELRRPIGVLLTRRGQVQEVIVGTELTLSSTTLTLFRTGARSLRGLRFIRTQLHDQPLNQEVLTDLAFLRLDLIGLLSVTEDAPIRQSVFRASAGTQFDGSIVQGAQGCPVPQR